MATIRQIFPPHAWRPLPVARFWQGRARNGRAVAVRGIVIAVA
jgi:hypothetical protein